MNLRADEISTLIQKQIQGFDEGIELKETGRIISVGDGIARIYGLEKAMAGELLSFPGGLSGMVLNLEEDNVGAILLGPDSKIKEGDEVQRTGRIMEVPIGPEMVGRVVDALGQPIDGKGLINASQSGSIERLAPGVVDRKSVLNICPKCGESLQRIHKNNFQKAIAKLFLIKIKSYTCKKCSFTGHKLAYITNHRD